VTFALASWGVRSSANPLIVKPSAINSALTSSFDPVFLLRKGSYVKWTQCKIGLLVVSAPSLSEIVNSGSDLNLPIRADRLPL